MSVRVYWAQYLQMARTQKNKATAHHLGMLKAKLAKLRRELITPSGGGGPKEEGACNQDELGDIFRPHS